MSVEWCVLPIVVVLSVGVDQNSGGALGGSVIDLMKQWKSHHGNQSSS